MAEYVCNVQTWGANPTYTEGQIIPEDCPYDVEAAAESGKVVTVEEYKQAHPDWDPAEEKKAAEEKAAFEKAFPGRDLPTAADPPDPEAEAALYAEAEQQVADEEAAKAQARGTDAGKPVQVQQGSGGSGSGSSSGGSGTDASRGGGSTPKR